jgi:two-component system response regulator YesN
VAEERNIRLTDHENEKEFYWDEISRAGTLTEIEIYLIQKIELMFRIIEEKENKGNVVFSVLRYIQENFYDRNLSIKTIAEYTYLTPTYLCLIFKKETGKTINQYITEVRIEKSKEYLKNRKIKIYEIASRVGYSDANYYAKVFEKIVGLNPSDFREKYLL